MRTTVLICFLLLGNYVFPQGYNLLNDEYLYTHLSSDRRLLNAFKIIKNEVNMAVEASSVDKAEYEVAWSFSKQYESKIDEIRGNQRSEYYYFKNKQSRWELILKKIDSNNSSWNIFIVFSDNDNIVIFDKLSWNEKKHEYLIVNLLIEK